jgi:hypothetical protein
MRGDVGLGQRVLAATRSPAAQAVASALDGLRVDRGNVLRVHHALKSEFYRLGDLMRMHGRELQVGRCGSDPVSEAAAAAFNTRLKTFAKHCTGYIQALGAAADALAQTAREYGYTEAQIAESFDAFQRTQAQGMGTPPAPGAPK